MIKKANTLKLDKENQQNVKDAKRWHKNHRPTLFTHSGLP